MVWRASTAFGCGVGLGTVPWPSMPGGVVGCKVCRRACVPAFQLGQGREISVGAGAVGNLGIEARNGRDPGTVEMGLHMGLRL
jgi:hypothetical protein